ncbi:3-oxoacyl-[acyl-carrier protein] reductase [Caulobacter ginsengisoli]|uniref:3-oxoacyl-[acyl-carrier protein] reductase n=1 Tax=Caulobacter ginsengisoli TaxID=400775 RepID=A0ABU0IU71_9CAUL|nr:glucose 1-dehydrogenase [Caulobacter ginsengisoli]MDQ0464579.1 3-oxoacyl-[acyl-carrier protein] reductase [Caulobacter ginsengisoli]
MNRLQNRLAIVTGGASGFGEGIVRRFVAEGARVIIVDRNGEAAAALAAELGDQTRPFTADVSKDADIAALAQAAGAVDILVNNAGIGHLPQPLDGLPEDEFDRLFAVNAKSVYLTARHFVPGMKARGSGAILNIASTGGVSPRPNLTWYNATKGWMITATRAMAVELAPSGVRVNALNPVAGETPLLATFMGQDTPEIRAKFLASIPLGRFSTPADMGAAAAFLCSDDAAMITGVAMEVDGGRCI